MENFIAFIVIAGGIALGILVGGLLLSLVLVKIYTGKKFIKRTMNRFYKASKKMTEKIMKDLSSYLNED